MKSRRFAAFVLAVAALLAAALLAFITPASANVRRGTLSYRQGSERPHLNYRVFWEAVDDATVKTTKVKLRVINRERPGSSRNWASVTIFVGGAHPGMGEAPWNGHGDWSAIAPAAAGGSQADDPVAHGASGATVVWSCELSLGSGVWKTRCVPQEDQFSDRYETWIRVRFHAPGRGQYWYRLTPPLG